MIYIAGPFFNDYQTSIIEKIKKTLEDLGIEYFSPKDKNKNVEKLPDEKIGKEFRQKIFIDNCMGMKDCNAAIAVIDDFDKGTIWEMGYLYAIGKPTIAFTDFPDRGLNIMLQESVVGFAKGFDDLKDRVYKYR